VGKPSVMDWKHAVQRQNDGLTAETHCDVCVDFIFDAASRFWAIKKWGRGGFVIGMELLVSNFGSIAIGDRIIVYHE